MESLSTEYNKYANNGLDICIYKNICEYLFCASNCLIWAAGVLGDNKQGFTL
jgi:hypothetical protein